MLTLDRHRLTANDSVSWIGCEDTQPVGRFTGQAAAEDTRGNDALSTGCWGSLPGRRERVAGAIASASRLGCIDASCHSRESSQPSFVDGEAYGGPSLSTSTSASVGTHDTSLLKSLCKGVRRSSLRVRTHRSATETSLG